MPAPNDRRPIAFRADLPSERGRGDPRRLIVAAAVFVAVVLIKPWPSVVRAPVLEQTPIPAIAARPSPPGPTPTAPSAVSLLCFEPLGWRLASIEMTLNFRLRGWGLLVPVSATDPRDPAIPRLTVVSPSVIALGYCAPVDRPPPDDVALTIYRLDPVRPPTPVDVVRLGPNPASPLGGLYLPAPQADPSGTIPATASWASGTYVFRLHAAAGYEQWFGADVRIVGA
jgi:hypothetical protein